MNRRSKAWLQFKGLAGVASGLALMPLRPGNVATFHQGRCGSTVLGSLLNQHRRVVWDGELFSPGRLEYLAGRLPAWVIRDPMRLLRLRMIRAGRAMYGFETQPTQLDRLRFALPQYIDRLRRMKFSHFILLQRKNHLRRIVSMMVGRTTAVWHNTGSQLRRLTRIELAVDNLVLNRGCDSQPRPLVEHLQRECESFRTLEDALQGQQVLQITYEEDISKDPLVAYRRVCEFVGVPCREVSIRHAKTNPFKLEEIILNFSEVASELRGSPFEWMLYA